MSIRLIKKEQLKRLKDKRLKAERDLKNLQYQQDFFLWAKDILGEPLDYYKWSEYPEYANHVWDGSEDPLYNSAKTLMARRWACILAATGVGKTFFLARVALWFLDVFEDSLVQTTAPNSTQLEKNLWGEIGTLMNAYRKRRPYVRVKHLSIKPEGNNPKCDYGGRYELMGMVAQVGAEEQSAVRFQGAHRENMLFILEEGAGIHPAVTTAIKNTASNIGDGGNNLIIMVGNPNSKFDELNKFSELEEQVDSYRISAYDHPNVVTDNVKFIGAVTRGSIELRKSEYGVDSPIFKSRVHGLTPEDEESSLIRLSWIQQCSKHRAEWKSTERKGAKAKGIDVANSLNGDAACVADFDGNVLDFIKEFTCPNAAHIVDNLLMGPLELAEKGFHNYGLISLRDRPVQQEAIAVDAVGVGVSTINQFLYHHIHVLTIQGGQWEEVIPKDKEGKPLYQFAGIRDQMYWELAKDFQKGDLVLDIPLKEWRQLSKELTAIKFRFLANRIAIESKDTIKKKLGGKSPNYSDALAMANWARKRYRVKSVAVPIFGGN